MPVTTVLAVYWSNLRTEKFGSLLSFIQNADIAGIELFCNGARVFGNHLVATSLETFFGW